MNPQFFDIEQRYLLIADYSALYPTTPNVIDAYVKHAENRNCILVVFIPKNTGDLKQFECLSATLEAYAEANCQIMIYEGDVGSEKELLSYVTTYITSRTPWNVDCAEEAFAQGVPCRSGFSFPIFQHSNHLYRPKKAGHKVPLSL